MPLNNFSSIVPGGIGVGDGVAEDEKKNSEAAKMVRTSRKDQQPGVIIRLR
jgi:hypothetical protein